MSQDTGRIVWFSFTSLLNILYEIKILYSRDILNIVKDFGTEEYKLYMKEVLAILKRPPRKF